MAIFSFVRHLGWFPHFPPFLSFFLLQFGFMCGSRLGYTEVRSWATSKPWVCRCNWLPWTSPAANSCMTWRRCWEGVPWHGAMAIMAIWGQCWWIHCVSVGQLTQKNGLQKAVASEGHGGITTLCMNEHTFYLKLAGEERNNCNLFLRIWSASWSHGLFAAWMADVLGGCAGRAESSPLRCRCVALHSSVTRALGFFHPELNSQPPSSAIGTALASEDFDPQSSSQSCRSCEVAVKVVSRRCGLSTVSKQRHCFMLIFIPHSAIQLHILSTCAE